MAGAATGDGIGAIGDGSDGDGATAGLRDDSASISSRAAGV
jgi:hypothetical protein